MSTNSTMFRLGMAMVMMLLLSFTQRSYASGTLAGTVISNQASVGYNAGTNARTATSNTLNITVGYKVSINLFASSSSTTTPDSTILYKPFYVFNNGNYPDNFSLTVAGVPAGWTAQLYKDINGDLAWDGGDSAVTSGGSLYTDTTIANRIPLILAITIPQGAQAADNQSAAITVDVESNGSGPAGVVRVGGVGTQTYTANVLIAKPVISYSVTPAYSANKIPGENQSFTLTISNTGHAATNGSSTVLWLFDNTNLENEVATSGSVSNDTASWSIGSIAALTGTASVTFSADIEQTSANGTGVAAGTTITNGVTGSAVSYSDGLHTYSVNVASTTAFTVGTASGAAWTVTPADSNGNPGDVIEYQFTLKNTGNHADNFTLSNTDASGDIDVAHVFALSSLGSSVTQLSSNLNAGSSVVLYVRVTVDVNATDGQTIKRTIVATTQTSSPIAPTGGATAANYNAPLTTTVTAPLLTVVMADSAAAGNVGTASNPAPGDVIYYIVRITNTGTGNATSVVSSNLNAHSSGNNNVYVANSVEVDTDYDNTFDVGPITDGATVSGITVTESSGTVQVQFGTIPSGATRVYRYRVTVQ